MKKLFKGGLAAGVGIVGLMLVVPQATYAAAPADHARSTSYTMAQVAGHNTAANCWTVVKHGVYDLTKWLPLNATAPITAAQICGLDGTKAFKTADAALKAVQHGDHVSDNDRNREGDGRGHDQGESSDHHSASSTVTPSTLSRHDDGDDSEVVTLSKSIKSYKIGELARTGSPTPTPTVTPTATPTVTPTPTPTPTVTPPATVTAAQLATHSTLANCWVAISGNVYNLTAFASTHSGGSAVIAPVCGKDGTSVFENRHGVGSSKISQLAQYKVGALVA